MDKKGGRPIIGDGGWIDPAAQGLKPKTQIYYDDFRSGHEPWHPSAGSRRSAKAGIKAAGQFWTAF